MKILVIHQYYLLPGRQGGSRFNEMSRMWGEAGHEVEIIAGTLDYATGEIPEKYRGRWITEEQDGDVKVWRCYVPGSYNRNYLGRMWAFAGFTLASCTAVLRVTPDVVIATSPPLTNVIPGWLAAKRSNARFVFEVRDLWPESAITTGVIARESCIARFLYGLERFACRKADLINVLTPAFREDIVGRRLAPDSKIAFVPNGADTSLFTPQPVDNSVRDMLGWGSRFVAVYAGAHGRANAVGQLVDAAEHLKSRTDILIASVGDGPERARWEEEARRRNLTNILFHGAQAKDRMPQIINAADVGIAVLQANPTFRTVYPNKVFDYMACAKPVLLAIDGVARRLVCEEAKAGLYVAPENGNEMAAAVLQLAQSPAEREKLGQNGLAWISANATRDVLAQRYLKCLSALCGKTNEGIIGAEAPDLRQTEID